MSEVIFSPWIPLGALVALALVARRLLGSWLAPGAFVALVWAVYAGACLLATSYEQLASGMWMIVALVFATQCGAVLSQTLGMRSTGNQAGARNQEPALDGLVRRALLFSMLFAVTALVGTLYCVVWSVHRFNLSFSLSDMLSLGHLWSVVRYGDGELEPWTVRLLTMWVYPAALLGGLVFATASHRRQRVLSFLPLACALINGVVEATRAGSLISVLCWLSSFFVVRYRQSHGNYALFNRRLVVALGTAAVCGFLFFLAIDSTRVLQPGEQFEIKGDQARWDKYFFGSVPAFNGWFHTYTQQTPALGVYTFAGIFDLLGLKTRPYGVYDDYYSVGGGEETNIYTLYRGLIEDFTPAGAVVFLFVIGLLAGAACRSHDRADAFLFQSGYYAFILYSPVISLFMYNGLVLAWCISALILVGRPRRYRLDTAQRVQEVPCR